MKTILSAMEAFGKLMVAGLILVLLIVVNVPLLVFAFNLIREFWGF